MLHCEAPLACSPDVVAPALMMMTEFSGDASKWLSNWNPAIVVVSCGTSFLSLSPAKALDLPPPDPNLSYTSPAGSIPAFGLSSGSAESSSALLLQATFTVTDHGLTWKPLQVRNNNFKSFQAFSAGTAQSVLVVRSPKLRLLEFQRGLCQRRARARPAPSFGIQSHALEGLMQVFGSPLPKAVIARAVGAFILSLNALHDVALGGFELPRGVGMAFMAGPLPCRARASMQAAIAIKRWAPIKTWLAMLLSSGFTSIRSNLVQMMFLVKRSFPTSPLEPTEALDCSMCLAFPDPRPAWERFSMEWHSPEGVHKFGSLSFSDTKYPPVRVGAVALTIFKEQKLSSLARKTARARAVLATPSKCGFELHPGFLLRAPTEGQIHVSWISALGMQVMAELQQLFVSVRPTRESRVRCNARPDGSAHKLAQAVTTVESVTRRIPLKRHLSSAFYVLGSMSFWETTSSGSSRNVWPHNQDFSADRSFRASCSDDSPVEAGAVGCQAICAEAATLWSVFAVFESLGAPAASIQGAQFSVPGRTDSDGSALGLSSPKLQGAEDVASQGRPVAVLDTFIKSHCSRAADDSAIGNFFKPFQLELGLGK